MGGERDRSESRSFNDRTPIMSGERDRNESRSFNDRTPIMGVDRSESRSFNDRTPIMGVDRRGNRCCQLISDLIFFFVIITSLGCLHLLSMPITILLVGFPWFGFALFNLFLPATFIIVTVWLDVWFNFVGSFWAACRRLLTCNYGYYSREF